MQGADVSRQGVQRDLLPLVEGTTVTTKYGMIKTDHVLFIASGAFQMSKPSDLIPELQGRLPIRVELNSLSIDDFERILTSTDACLTRQYEALLGTEQVHLDFRPDGIRRLAEIAHAVNEKQENIGARRLYTVMERPARGRVVHAARRTGDTIAIDAAFVDARLAGIAGDDNLRALHPVMRVRLQPGRVAAMLERILGIILPVFLIILLGYLYARRVKPDMSMVNRISMNVLAPALIFSVLASKDFDVAAHWKLMLGSVGVVVGSGLIAWAIARFMKVDPRTLVPPVMFNNCGNMGLPLAALAYGAAGFGPMVAAVRDLQPAAFHARRVDHQSPREVREPAAQSDGGGRRSSASRSRLRIRRCRKWLDRRDQAGRRRADLR
jgi:hypothetical protein